MARKFGYQVSTLSLAAQSLLADTLSIDYQDQADTEDSTTLGDTAHEFTAGLTGGDDISWVLFYENTATTGTWAFLVGKIGVAGTLIIGDGTRTISFSAIVTKVSMPIQVANMIKFTATLKKTGVTTYS